MKSSIKFNYLLATGLVALTALYSCQKQSQASLQGTTGISSELIASNSAILVASASTTGPVVATDAIYAINAYPPGAAKDSVTFASLPTAISTYLTANYALYTYQKSFKFSNASGVTDYVVVILFNGKPVALKFDSAGTFVAVLEQCEGHDLGEGGRGRGWHEGGRFGDRDDMHRDTIAISALPTVIKAYFTANYATDTLLHAAVNPDGVYVVISTNNGLYATALTSTGTFIKRMAIYPHANKHVAIDASALPAAITTYLTTTFPGYVLDKAFVEKTNSVVQEYDVFINVNGTRHAIEFDATGAFVRNIVIR